MHMTQNFGRTERFDKENRHFGGLVYPSDFNTNRKGTTQTHGSAIAARIESDFRREQSLNREKAWINYFNKGR